MTPDQRLAAWDRGIRTLLITGSHKKAANDADCNLQTWHQWRKDDAWKQLFDLRRDQAASVTVEEMGGLFAEAREVFHEAMQPEQKIEVRLKAASKVADLVVRKQDLSAVSPAIAALAVEVKGSDAASELRRRRLVESHEPEPAGELPPGPEDDEDAGA